MLGAWEDSETNRKATTERALGKHAHDCFSDESLWLGCHDFAIGANLETTWVTTPTTTCLQISLAAGEHNLRCIGDDDRVTRRNTWCVFRTVLSHEGCCNFRCEPSEDESIGVHMTPYGVDFVFLSDESLAGHIEILLR